MSAEVTPAIVALLTDFGDRDGYVAAVKAAILTTNPAAQILDISHLLPHHDIKTAAFVWWRVFSSFPPGSVQVAVVDPGVGSERGALAGEIDGRYVVAPDNGLISYLVHNARTARFIRLLTERYWAEQVSFTFHGRDVFAYVAAHLTCGVRLEHLGEELDNPRVIELERPSFSAGKIRGVIVYKDQFGNLISNVPNELLRESSVVLVDKMECRVVTSYAAGETGELVALPGSSGLIELAVREASAAEQYGLTAGTAVEVRL